MIQPLYIVEVPEEDVLDELLMVYHRWGLPPLWNKVWWAYLAWYYYENNNIGEA